MHLSKWAGLRTRSLVTDVTHDLGRPLDVDLHTSALEPFDDYAHPSQSRDELECADDAKLEEVSVLSICPCLAEASSVYNRHTLVPDFNASSSRKLPLPGGRTTVWTSAADRSPNALPSMRLGAPLPTCPSSSTQLVNSNIFTSRGSPITSPSMTLSE